ncbi:MAG: glycerol kinase GlpK [Dehalococcoidia bacterium]|nr:glycerol kinase GlpK [Dehalococcoidia bacterium]
MAATYILALDQGTTSSRALVVDARGQVVGRGQEEFAQHYPEPGRVEHDPADLWQSTLNAARKALRAAGIGARELAAIGITNQRETLVAWDRRTGEPVAPAIVWQDRRTAPICEELREAGHEPAVQAASGLILDPYFTGTKVTWLLRERPDLRRLAAEGNLAFGTVDSWLVWKLTGGERHVTDYTNASRTLLFNIDSGAWDDGLIELLDVPRGSLPEVLPSRGEFGTTAEEVLGAEVPILAVAGDQQAALFGQACFAEGQAKNTYGTGCFLLAHGGGKSVRSANRLLTSLGAGSAPGQLEYVLEGSVFVAGSLVQWLRDGLGLIEASSDVEELARSVADAGGVTIVPAFTGLGAPHWDPHARGAVLGITRGVERGHVARAALEAIALSSAELALAMASDLGEPIRELRADGGAARNDLLMQLQADYLGCPVVRPRHTESTAVGAAYLAGLEAGVWAGQDEVEALWAVDRVFEPVIGEDERGGKLANWRRAVARTLRWAAEE